MRPEGGPLSVDELLRPRHGRREADAVLGVADVVVHRLGDRDERHAADREHVRVPDGVVAADHDEVVDPEPREVVDHDGREVVAAVGIRVARGIIAQMLRKVFRPRPAGIRA